MNTVVKDVIIVLTAIGILLTVVIANVPALPEWVAVSLACVNALVAFLNRTGKV